MAISVSTVIGDMSVAVAGTYVGKGRSRAAVRAQDSLCRERSVTHYSLSIQYTLARDVMKNATTHALRIKEMAPP
jgi:hypothetical protein